jgi:oxalate---CoA ligase
LVSAGCNVSRLSEFIATFYKHGGSEERQQNVDDAFCAFVWSVIVQQSNVRVGIVPEGEYAEVYIAPQTSAKRKAKEKGKAIEKPLAPITLQLVDDAKLKGLNELQAQYGDRLRIAVDPDTSYTAITGMHIRVRTHISATYWLLL